MEANMKHISTIRPAVLALSFMILVSGGCEKAPGYNEIISTDQTKPGIVTDVAVHNFEGGAYITYTLPTSDNLLYVLAEYKINDEISRQKKASYYTDTILVDGFAKSKDYEVTLYSVSRANLKSDPVTVKVHPGTPPYLAVFPTITVQPDFGGVHVSTMNADSKPVGVVVVTRDENGDLSPVEQVYSDDTSIAFTVRGYEASPREFGVYITDPWSNNSDTLFSTLTPLHEQQFDRNRFSQFRLPSDAPEGYGWTMSNLWNGTGTGTGYHTAVGTGMPQTFTFDLGVTGKISRFRVWERGDNYAYAHGNPKRWALWGSNDPEDDALPADVSALKPGHQVDSWTFIGYFEVPPKPSGRPSGDNTPEDLAANAAGFEFNVSIELPPLRYIRFQTLESFSGGDFMHMTEIAFWGNPQ